jgi:hypothetical protein
MWVNTLIVVVMKLAMILFSSQGFWFGAYFISEWNIGFLDKEHHKRNCILLTRNFAKLLVYRATCTP